MVEFNAFIDAYMSISSGSYILRVNICVCVHICLPISTGHTAVLLVPLFFFFLFPLPFWFSVAAAPATATDDRSLVFWLQRFQ